MPKLTLEDLQKIKQKHLADIAGHYKASIMVCGGSNCISGGGIKIKEALDKELETKGLAKEIKTVLTGCSGFCAEGPIITVYPDGVFYEKLKPEDMAVIVEEHLVKGAPVEKFLYKDPAQKNTKVARIKDIAFFKGQHLRALKNRGIIDPEDIEDYIARDGYHAAAKALNDMSPSEIIKTVKSSGLRGRGGAGFLTGMKWELCSMVPGETKYIICNGDEGDPGAFMDRYIMEADPHVIIEGMIIAGRAFGATKGYIYTRAEYPMAVQRLSIALKQARERGLLGEGILGSDYNLDIELFQGAGAFVCGEETALMRAIEGKRGMPVPRPPFPVQKGLWGKPSVLNNVETMANVPLIIEHGVEWFRSVGTEKSPGTKVFALSGSVNNVGPIEVPMGITLKTIINDIGGGLKRGRTFKAVQLGGPSGGCLPESLLDTPVTYEDINKTGAIVGSGGMVVMDDQTCIVQLTKFFMEFMMEESCGKCPPCRIGTKVIFDKLVDITEGRGVPEDIDLLVDLSEDIINTSLCGLGQTAPNPVLTTIKYFREEYEEHISQKWCRAGICKENLVTFVIDQSKCVGCGACARACPMKTIIGEKKQPHLILQDNCVRCRSCMDSCKFGAVTSAPAPQREVIIEEQKALRAAMAAQGEAAAVAAVAAPADKKEESN